MKSSTEQMESFKQAIKEKELAFKKEEYQIVIKLPTQVNMLRVTYSKYKGGRLTEIEEITPSREEIMTSCKFRGKTHSGECSDGILNVKPLLTQLRPSDYVECNGYVDEHYKIYK